MLNRFVLDLESESVERNSDNLSAFSNRRQLEFNRDKCKILNEGAEPSAGQDSKWKGDG